MGRGLWGRPASLFQARQRRVPELDRVCVCARREVFGNPPPPPPNKHKGPMLNSGQGKGESLLALCLADVQNFLPLDLVKMADGLHHFLEEQMVLIGY